MTVAYSDPSDGEIPHNRFSDAVGNDFQQPCRRRMTREVHSLRRCDDVLHPTLLDDLERDLRPKSAEDDSVNLLLVNVTMMDTTSDASGVAREEAQVPATRGRRLRILGTQPTFEDFPSSNRFSPLEDDSESDTVSES